MPTMSTAGLQSGLHATGANTRVSQELDAEMDHPLAPSRGHRRNDNSDEELLNSYMADTVSTAFTAPKHEVRRRAGGPNSDTYSSLSTPKKTSRSLGSRLKSFFGLDKEKFDHSGLIKVIKSVKLNDEDTLAFNLRQYAKYREDEMTSTKRSKRTRLFGFFGPSVGISGRHKISAANKLANWLDGIDSDHINFTKAEMAALSQGTLGSKLVKSKLKQLPTSQNERFRI